MPAFLRKPDNISPTGPDPTIPTSHFTVSKLGFILYLNVPAVYEVRNLIQTIFILHFGLKEISRSYSVVVSTPDFESGDAGSNPARTYSSKLLTLSSDCFVFMRIKTEI